MQKKTDFWYPEFMWYYHILVYFYPDNFWYYKEYIR